MDHKFNSGTILAQTFSTFFGNIVPFGLICTLVLSPSLIAQGWMLLQQSKDPLAVPWAPIALMLLSALLTPVATGALTYGVFQEVRGKHASIGECLSVGLSRLFPVLGVGIIVGLAAGIGMLFCLVPGFIVMSILAVAVPTAVIEKPGVGKSLSRSADLTEGHRWTVFGVVFGLALLSWIVVFPLQLLFAGSLPALLASTAVITILSTGLNATAPSLIYYHLRKAKESIDVEEIASIFD